MEQKLSNKKQYLMLGLTFVVGLVLTAFVMAQFYNTFIYLATQ
jgi:hypothetical protein